MNMRNIILFNNGPKDNEKYRKIIRKAINETVKAENFTDKAELSVTLTNNEEIRRLNKQYRNINKETDVLSFPTCEAGGKYEINPDNNAYILGDIVISLEKAEEQAEEYGHSIDRELAFLTVHSVLHLLGYDHELSENDEEKMFKRQEEILQQAGLNN